MTGSPHEARRDVEAATTAHRRLLDDLGRLLAREELDIAAPSALPGWTVGHVITHLANSGDGHALMFEAAARGARGEQYPHGAEGRRADIEAGAGRPPGEQMEALRTSIARLEEVWSTTTWTGTGLLATGAEVTLTELPFLRLREVAIHHIDLVIGASFAELPGDYVRRELRQLEMSWTARQPMGLTGLPVAVVGLAPTDRLAWLTGRLAVEGVPAAAVW